jgi:nicotinate-nucleotide adenylyltransferase
MDAQIFETLKRRLELAVKQKRFEHCLRVTQTAGLLCRKFTVDSVKTSIAAISHDMCKEYSYERQLILAMQDGQEITELEQQKPALLHGRAAAIVLQDEYGITDEEILEAVRVHTFGKPAMCNVSKILYLADKIEPGRKHITEEYMHRLDAFSLDELLYFVVDENISYLEQKGEQVSPVSYMLRESL